MHNFVGPGATVARAIGRVSTGFALIWALVEGVLGREFAVMGALSWLGTIIAAVMGIWLGFWVGFCIYMGSVLHILIWLEAEGSHVLPEHTWKAWRIMRPSLWVNAALAAGALILTRYIGWGWSYAAYCVAYGITLLVSGGYTEKVEQLSHTWEQ